MSPTTKERSSSARDAGQARVEVFSRSLGSGFRVSWGAVFAGALFALSIWILLVALGGALARSFPGANWLFSGIWNFLAPLVALFIGAMVTGRAAPSVTRTAGGVHGFLVWSMASVFGATLAANILGSALPMIARSQTQAAGTTSTTTGAGALWIAFVALALSLGSAVAGAMAGVSVGKRTGQAEGAGVSAGARTPPPGVPIRATSAEAMVEQRTAELRQEIASVRQELHHAMEARDLPHVPPTPGVGPH